MIDHWSTMHPLQLKPPVDLSTSLAGKPPRFPAIFFCGSPRHHRLGSKIHFEILEDAFKVLLQADPDPSDGDRTITERQIV